MNQEIKISVIIPIYNSEKYLSECLDSVINQSYSNLEIILVNDGSTDSSGKICDEYSQLDQRIRVVHQLNGGLSDARNSGLKIANGDFISFVDNDDLLSASFYETLIKVALENTADVVECNFVKFVEESDIDKVLGNSPVKTEIYSTEEALELIMKEYLKQIVWNKIYRKDVLKDLFFPEGKMNEDEYWTYKVFGNAKIVLKIGSALYYYRQHPASMMGKSYAIHRLDGLNALEERISYVKEYFPNLEDLAIKIFCGASLWHYQKIDRNSGIDSEMIYREKILSNAKKYYQAINFKKWKKKEIFWYHLFMIAPNIYAKFRNLIKIGI